MIPSVEKLVRFATRHRLWLWGPTTIDVLIVIAIWGNYALGLGLLIYGFRGLMMGQIWASLIFGPVLLITARVIQWLHFGDTVGMGGR
jgi:hypothetical protein